MISILISTIDERIKQVKDVLLEPRKDVEYIISHQYTSEEFKEIPEILLRNDVTISQLKGKGVTKSRNNALSLAKGDIGLFADDDVTYRNYYIDKIKKIFQDNPDMDIGLFKIKTRPSEKEYKHYPDHQKKLTKNIFSVSSVEIACRIGRVKAAGLSFDERFGAGNDLLIGSEETIFIEDCLEQGLNVVFFPEYIVEHPYDSTIKSVPKFDKRKNWLTGAYDCRKNGSLALPKALLGTLKILPELLRHKVNPITYFYHRLSAVIYILSTKKKSKIPADLVFDPSSDRRSDSQISVW